MAGPADNADADAPALEAFLLGRVPFERCLEVQRRFLDDVAARDDGRVVLLVCEHEPVITVGRAGSPLDVAPADGAIKSRQLDVRWVARGGGAMVHCPGQLAVYPIVPLRWHGFSVGEYLDRLQRGIADALRKLGFPVSTRPGEHGIWGRTGQLVAFGAAVRDWVTYHGAFVNVSPSLGLFRVVEAAPNATAKISSLVAERRRPVRMTGVRAELIPRLAEAFGCDRYHLHTGHPMLRRAVAPRR